jgi:hypothetical protein
MATNARRQRGILAGLLVLLAAVVVYQVAASRSVPSGTAARPPARPAQAAGKAPAGSIDVPDVRLDALKQARPEMESHGRNLFREQPKAPPPPPPSQIARAPQAPDPNAPPPPPPPPPPIPLKFIGVVQAGGRSLAVLTDGRDVFYGREGEVVEGQYRIVRIGVESVEMSYVDGRGRQTIRLSG